MSFMTSFSYGIQATFLSLIIVGAAILLTISIAIFKTKIKKHTITILYCFTGGFMLPLGILGLAGGGISNLEKYYQNEPGWKSSLIIMAVVATGALLAFAIYFISRYLLTKKEIHSNHERHSHADEALNYAEIDSTNRKWLAVIFILLHRIPAGLTLGFLLYGLNNNLGETISLGIIIGFALHVIPESLIIYYRQIELKKSPIVALRNAVLAKLLLIPFIFIGVYFADWIQNIFWLFPLLLITAGLLITLTSILELLPEFLHISISKKNWSYIVFAIMSGLLVSFIVLVIAP